MDPIGFGNVVSGTAAREERGLVISGQQEHDPATNNSASSRTTPVGARGDSMTPYVLEKQRMDVPMIGCAAVPDWLAGWGHGFLGSFQHVA